MRKEEFKTLITRYLDGTATQAERLLVEEYYNRLAAMKPAKTPKAPKTPLAQAPFAQPVSPAAPASPAYSAYSPGYRAAGFGIDFGMIKSNFKIGYRNLVKSRVFSLINIFGLAIGMAACFFIVQYIRFERSYDRWHKNVADLYRVPMGWSDPFSADNATANCYPALAPALKAEFPEVVDFARVAPATNFTATSVMSYTDPNGETKKFNELNYYISDASFLTIFSFPLLEGDPKTALAAPNSIVITETTSRKYFGDAEPMGKILVLNGSQQKVTGVLKDIPENSHIKFDMLLSLSTLDAHLVNSDWGNPAFYNYVLLAPGTDPKKVDAQLSAFVDKYLGEKRKELNIHFSFQLQPITDIHLKSNMSSEAEVNGSEKTLYFLAILGVFILGIAWINYINLSTAKSMERAREVGVRKVAGATRLQLCAQFMLESLLINTAALFVAVLIIAIAAPYFNNFVGKKISADFLYTDFLHSWKFWLIMPLVFVAAALQVGVYPAFVLSAFKPVAVLKGKFHRSGRSILLRKGLVTFQFVLSLLLIAGTIIVYRQLSYMRDEDPGYKKEQLLIVKAPALTDSTFVTKTDVFKTELLRDLAISHFAPSSDIPGTDLLASNGVRLPGQEKTKNIDAGLIQIDRDYLATYQIPLACGSNLPELESGNVFRQKSTKVLINERLVQALGYPDDETALHKRILLTSWFGDINCEVVGVVKNVHQKSLREPYRTTMYFHNSEAHYNYFTLRINPKNLRGEMAKIEKIYNSNFPGNAFETFFLDDYFNLQYQSDQRFGNIFSLFTILAICIACLGLVGLSTFAIKLRTKEIGIRKVLGASAHGVVYLFFEDFLKLVLLASVIAIPIVYYFAGRWLSNFAFHTRLSWWIFVAAPVLLAFISLLTTGLQSLKVALANPVKSLRTD